MIGIARRLPLLFCWTALVSLSTVQVSAQDGFYKGKTIGLIVGLAPGGGTDDIPKVLKAILGLPLQMVSGYKGTGPVRLAFNAGEV